jgi:hypothetical protein
VSLTIPNEYKEILANENIFANLTISNLGFSNETEVTITYIVKNFENNMIKADRDRKKIKDYLSYSREIKLPKSLPPGEYVAIAEVESNEAIGVASDNFNVVEELERKSKLAFPKGQLTSKSYILVLLIFILLIIIIILIKYKFRKINQEVNDYIGSRFKS